MLHQVTSVSGRLCLMLFCVSLHRHIPLNYTDSCHLTTLPPKNHPVYFSDSQHVKQHLEGKPDCNFPTCNSKQNTELETSLACFRAGLWKRQAKVRTRRRPRRTKGAQWSEYLTRSLSQSHHPKPRGLWRTAEGIRKEKHLQLQILWYLWGRKSQCITACWQTLHT